MKNKPSILVLLMHCLTLCLVLSACGKNPPEPAPDGDNEYSVTFSVNGTDTVVKVAAGQIPEFTGSTEKPDDSEHAYKFIGWDKEIVPATADTTYVAQYQTLGLATVTVRWYLADVQVNYTAHEGEQLTPPAEFSTNPQTVDKIYTFVNWMIGSDKSSDLPVVDADMIAKKNLVIRGNYTSIPREYDVTFMSGGVVLRTVKTEYGKLPEYPDGTPTKAGLNFSFWTNGSEPVTGDVTCEAVFAKLDPEQIAFAYTVPLMAYTGNSDNTGDMMQIGSSVLYMAMEVRANPNGAGKFVDRILEHLRNLIKPGNTPYFDLEPYWSYVNVTSAITVCKFTPAIWDKLTAEEKDTYDFIMKSFAYILAFGTSDQNNYLTGPGMMGNYAKTWNPNYKLANVVPMLFVGKYFGGADAVDTILAAFSYDDTVAQFKERGFTRAYKRWTTTPADGCPTPKQFMENGGPAYLAKRIDSTGRLSSEGGEAAGTGAGVRVKYRYQGYTLDDVAGIFNFLLADNYGGGKVLNDSSGKSNGKYTENNFLDKNHTELTEKEAALIGTLKAYFPVMEEIDGVRTFKTDALGNWIVDTTASSPVAGLPGMMKEMNSADGGDGTHGDDIRFSCAYCVHDFVMIVDALAAMEELGMYDITEGENVKYFRLAWVGNEDFIYKNTRGFISFSLGYGYTSLEDTEVGYLIWKSWWNTKFGHYTYETLPEAEEQEKDPEAPICIDFTSKVPVLSGRGFENGSSSMITDGMLRIEGFKTYHNTILVNIFDNVIAGRPYRLTFKYKLVQRIGEAEQSTFRVCYTKEDRYTSDIITEVTVKTLGEWETASVEFTMNLPVESIKDLSIHTNGLGVDETSAEHYILLIDDIELAVLPPVNENLVLEEKYDNKNVVAINSMPEYNNIVYGTKGKNGVAMQTVNTDPEGKALRIMQEAGADDSFMYVYGSTIGLANALNGYDKITVSFSAAKLADAASVSSSFRFRGMGTSADVVGVFAINDKGEVTISGKNAEGETVKQTVRMLDTTYQNFKVVVDFEKQTVAGYAENTLVTDELSLVLPSTAGDKTAKEWAADATGYLFYWYVSSNNTEAPRVLFLDNISVVASK